MPGREKARLALGETEQDVMELDWRLALGCAPALQSCPAVTLSRDTSKVPDCGMASRGAVLAALHLSTAAHRGLLFITPNVHCKTTQ